MKFKVFSMIFALQLNAFALNNPKPNWGYDEETGAHHWGDLNKSFHLCEDGSTQSPIDIKETISADLPSIEFFYSPFLPKVINNGHTIEVDPNEKQGIKVGEDFYQLVQFHFHTPSEYHIESKAYPLELHFVHQKKDKALGVIGVMFKEGAANPELEKIWQNMPRASGEEKQSPVMVDIVKLLPMDKKYYRFMGSLTTPPCSEGVNWMIMQKQITASKAQIEAFRKIIPMNARPIQPSNNRLIVKDAK